MGLIIRPVGGGEGLVVTINKSMKSVNKSYRAKQIRIGECGVTEESYLSSYTFYFEIIRFTESNENCPERPCAPFTQVPPMLTSYVTTVPCRSQGKRRGTMWARGFYVI